MNWKFLRGGLVALAILSACSVSPREAERQIRADLLAIDQAVTKYARYHNDYPSSLLDLRNADANGRSFLDSAVPLEDPYGNSYLYTSPGSGLSYSVYSLGSDGSLGGEEAGADIDLAMLRKQR